MGKRTGEIGTSVVPVLRYRDLPGAIDWLSTAFGFAAHRIDAANDGEVLFAHLTFGDAMVMVGPVGASAFDNLLKQPDEIGGAETQVCYFHVADARAHCARAKAAGAKVLFNVEDPTHGGHSYSCRDPEGHLWNFGTYNPWQSHSKRLSHSRLAKYLRGTARAAVAVATLGVVIAFIAASGGKDGRVEEARNGRITTGSSGAPVEGATLPLGRLHPPERETVGELPSSGQRDPTKQALEDARERLIKALQDKQAAERSSAEARRELERALQDKNVAEQTAKEAQERLTRMWIGRNLAERSAKIARQQLARERSARKAAEGALASEQQQSPPAPRRW